MKKVQLATDRPAYMMVADLTEQPNWNGYTLQIDYVDLSASIINLKKG